MYASSAADNHPGQMVSTTYEVLCSESTPYKVHFIHVAPPRPSDITPLRSDAGAQMPRHYICISAFSRLNEKKICK